jgi:hypothetical protein
LLGKGLVQTPPMLPPELPEVHASDPEPVSVAIETARALFRTGDRTEALRWLRRAAERAEESGNDLRAVMLARVAADLSNAMQSSIPPSSANYDEASALAPYDDFNDKTVVDAPVLSPIRDAFHSEVRITEMADSKSASRPHVVSPPVISAPKAREVAQRSRQAVRVAVARDPEGGGALLVRVLPDGAKAPTGTEEALLVALDPTTDWLKAITATRLR